MRSRSRAAKRSSARRRRSLTSERRCSTCSRAARAAVAAFSASPSRPSPWRSSSAISCARSPISSRSMRAPSSAACAWRFSGRSRDRASRSTSRARARLSPAAFSFSSARRRRLRCLPRPAASSTSSRRSRGFEWTMDSTRPWLITECISRPRLVSLSTSTMSTRRQRAPFRRYPPSPLRSRLRCTEISENSEAARPSELSITTSTSAWRRRPTPSPPAEITSCIEAPRTAPGLCSPSAQRTASVMFDLPEPLGPTITLTPGENWSLVRSGNDLNPFSEIDLRCMWGCLGSRSGRTQSGERAGQPSRRSSAASAATCSAAFLLRPEPLPTSSPARRAATSKVRSCGGPASVRTS